MVTGSKGVCVMTERPIAARSIKELSKTWRAYTERVITFREVFVPSVRLLLLETYTILHALKQKRLVPKSVCELLCEMQNFAWWINGLKSSSLHGFYPLIVSAIDEMRTEFIADTNDTESIARFLKGELDKTNSNQTDWSHQENHKSDSETSAMQEDT